MELSNLTARVDANSPVWTFRIPAGLPQPGKAQIWKVDVEVLGPRPESTPEILALLLGETPNAVASSSRSNAAASMTPQEKEGGRNVAQGEEHVSKGAEPVDALDGGDHQGADDDEAGSSTAPARGEGMGEVKEGVAGETEKEKEKADEPAPPATPSAPPRSSKRGRSSKPSTSSRSLPTRGAKDPTRRQQALARSDTPPLAAKHAESKSKGKPNAGSDDDDKQESEGEQGEGVEQDAGRSRRGSREKDDDEEGGGSAAGNAATAASTSQQGKSKGPKKASGSKRSSKGKKGPAAKTG